MQLWPRVPGQTLKQTTARPTSAPPRDGPSVLEIWDPFGFTGLFHPETLEFLIQLCEIALMNRPTNLRYLTSEIRSRWSVWYDRLSLL